MGAWDVGPFDNDGARDLMARLAGSEPGEVAMRLWSAMDPVVECCDYLENPQAQCATAAAVIVAVGLGAPPADDTVTRFIADRPFNISVELRDRAYRTLNRVTTRGDNEWFEQWEDAGFLPAALERLDPYRSSLAPGGDDRRPDPVAVV